MTPLKLNRAFALAGITMPTVRAHIERNLADVASSLQDATAKQLAAVIRIHHVAYTQGRAACGAEVIDDAVWIGAGVDKLIPTAALRALAIDNLVESVRKPYAHPCYPHAASIRDVATGLFVGRDEFEMRKLAGEVPAYYYDESQHTTRISLDYTERV